MAEDVAYLRHSAEEVDDLLDDVVSIAELEVKDRAALTELIDTGAKNFMENNAASQTIYSVSFTVNDDKSVTADGTASSAAWLIMAENKKLKAGTYVISGGTAAVRVVLSTSQTAADIIAQSQGTPVEFTLSSDTDGLLFAVRMSTNAVADNTTVYPMICTKAAWDISEAYQPYRPSYQELYEMVLALGGGGNRLMSINREEVTGNETNETDNTQGDIS